MKRIISLCIVLALILVSCEHTFVANSTLTPTVQPSLTPTQVKVLLVGGSGSYTSIQSAIDAADDGDSILVAQGIYIENIIIHGPINIHIEGGWTPDFSSRSEDNSRTVINGSKKGSVLKLLAGQSADISLIIENFTLVDGIADRGGGVSITSDGDNSTAVVSLQNNTIKNNLSTVYGGGIWTEASGPNVVIGLELMGNSITANESAEGGGIAVTSMSGAQVDINLINNDISNNTGTTSAAGIWLNSIESGSRTNATLTRNTILNNSGLSFNGGGLAAYASGAGSVTTLELYNNQFLNNKAGYGGGIFLNSWGNGAAMNATLSNNIIAGNQATEMFGGLAFSSDTNAKGNLKLTNNTITNNNSANHPAGGLFVVQGGGGQAQIPLASDLSQVVVSLNNDILWGNMGSNGPNDIDMYSYLESNPASITASFSIVGMYTNFQTNYNEDYGLNSDPLFEDPANNNFLLSVDSSAIDAGDPSSSYYDGFVSPGFGTQVNDLGAYGGPRNDSWLATVANLHFPRKVTALIPVLTPESSVPLLGENQDPRKGTAMIKLQDQSGAPLANVSVDFNQTTHDFLFGVGTRATAGQLPGSFFDDFQTTGINYLLPTTCWGILEPSPGNYDWMYIDSLDPRLLSKKGFTIQGHLMIAWQEGPTDTPEYLKSLNFDELIDAIHSHVVSLVTHYKGVIKYWTINEIADPRSDSLHLTLPQWIEIIKTAGQAIRATDPEAKLLLNIVVDDHNGYSPHSILDALVAQGVDFDAIGLEIYPGMVPSDQNGYPDIDNSRLKIESFVRFNKPIFITEISVNDKPSPEIQAEWLQSFYSMAFRIPSVKGIAWFYTVDDPFWIYSTAGLFPDANSAPRPIYQTLANVIRERTTTGVAITDSNGILNIEGYAGNYEIHVNNSDESEDFIIHIFEEQATSFSFSEP